MAGRRLRNKVKDIVVQSGLYSEKEVHVTIAGLANGYSSYVTTYEEYQAQRYEAASTIFGPYTLDGYLQEFSRLTQDLISGVASRSDAPPEDLTSKLIEMMPTSKFDRVPLGSAFGDVLEQPSSSYKPGYTVQVKFRAANPRNNARLGGTFLKVQMKNPDVDSSSSWIDIAYDGDWETKFHWENNINDPFALGLTGVSTAEIKWNIPSDTSTGYYR